MYSFARSLPCFPLMWVSPSFTAYSHTGFLHEPHFTAISHLRLEHLPFDRVRLAQNSVPCMPQVQIIVLVLIGGMFFVITSFFFISVIIEPVKTLHFFFLRYFAA